MKQVLQSIPNLYTTTEQQKFRLGSRSNLYFERNPAQHLSTYSQRTSADIYQRVLHLCGLCKSCARYTVHMTLYEARHFYVVFVDQTRKNRWAYPQIFQDCKTPFRWDFRTSSCTGLFFNTTDHCRNHAAVRRLTHPVSEFLLQLVFSRWSPSVLPSGNSVFLVYEVRWFSTPLRLETMRTHRLPQVLRLSPFPLSQSPGQKFTVAGSATNSPVSSSAITRHHQTWVHILLVRVWIRRQGQTFMLHLYCRARLHHPLY